MSSGQVTLSLRGDQDKNKGISLTPLTVRDLLGGDGLFEASKNHKNILSLRQPDGSLQKYALSARKTYAIAR